MAEILEFHRFRQQTLPSQSATASVVVFEEDPFVDLCTHDFESISPPFPSSLQGSTSILRQSDYGSHGSVGNSIFFTDEDIDDDADQMSFITDLFSSRCVQLGIPEDRDSIFVEVGSQTDEEPNLGVGLGLDDAGGLRVTDMESESDSEAVEVIPEADGIINDRDRFHYFDMEFPGCLDSLAFHGHHGNVVFDWEEFNERENISSVIDRIEEIAISSDGENLSIFNGGEEEEEDYAQFLDWQFLLALNDLEINSDFDGDQMLQDFVDTDNSIKGSPPASIQTVENLPLMVLSAEYLRANSLVCAVCNDEINVDEKITKLPCSHHYHMPCIIPWLKLHNTCPLCRYEFPTDDADYERIKNGGDGGIDSIPNFDVRYNHQLLP